MPTGEEQIAQLEAAIAALEAQRALLGNAVVDVALVPLRGQIDALRTPDSQGPMPIAQSPPAMEGEFKLVTILFADLSGFTALSERLDPEQVRSRMNACFDWLVPSVRNYGGHVDKFIGDSIMALFGAPIAHENAPERALRAALEMREALTAFNREHGLDLGLHFGINTGRVVAGGLGSHDRLEYSVTGDPVNVAARLEEASERGEILVGPDTYRRTAPLFEFEPLPPLAVKGRSEPVAAYRLLGVKSVPGALRGITGLHSSLVGREAEFATLRAAFAALQEGQGGSIALIGEAGQGKSRLVAEARQAASAHVRWVEGRALSYDENISYAVARDALLGLIGVKPDSDSKEIGIALRGSVERWCPAQMLEVYPYLARLLDVPLDPPMAERVQYLTPEALQRRIHQAMLDLVRAQSLPSPGGGGERGRGLVLAWEDLHWADPSSLQMLERLLPLTDEVPLLMLFLFRAEEGRIREFHERLAGRAGASYRVIELNPLTRDESSQLLANLLRIENLPEATRQMILDKAEGNAFFLEEVLRSLIDAGLVVMGKERASLAPEIEDVHVPDTLQGVVAARIDRLAPEDKRTLQTASVIGRVFQQRILARLLEVAGTGKEAEQLDHSLDDLQYRAFIRRRGTAADWEYIFKHVVTQEVAYDSLLYARRKELHRVIAEVMEGLFPDHWQELSPTLGYHYERAEIPDRAIHYLTHAGDRARATYANEEAIALYQGAVRQAQRLIGAEPEREQHWQSVAGRLHENAGDVFALTARHQQARDAYQDAQAHVPKPDRIGRSRLCRKIGNTWDGERRFDDAFQAYDRAEAVLQLDRSDALPEEWQEWIQIQFDRERCHYWLDQPDEMTELVEQIRPVLEQHGTPVLRARFYSSHFTVAFRRHRYVAPDEAVADAKAALIAYQEAADLLDTAYAQFRLGFLLLWRRELIEAEAQIRACLTVVERIGDVTVQSQCLCYLAVLHRQCGQVGETRHGAARALTTATEAKRYDYVGAARANQAWVAWREADPTQARAHGEAALEWWQKHPGTYPFQWMARWPLIGVALADGQLAQAIEHARSLLDANQMRLPDPIASGLEQAIQSWDNDLPDTARTHLQHAMVPARDLGYL